MDNVHRDGVEVVKRAGVAPLFVREHQDEALVERVSAEACDPHVEEEAVECGDGEVPYAFHVGESAAYEDSLHEVGDALLVATDDHFFFVALLVRLESFLAERVGVQRGLWDEAIDWWDPEESCDQDLHSNDEEVPMVSGAFLQPEFWGLTEERRDVVVEEEEHSKYEARHDREEYTPHRAVTGADKPTAASQGGAELVWNIERGDCHVCLHPNAVRGEVVVATHVWHAAEEEYRDGGAVVGDVRACTWGGK